MTRGILLRLGVVALAVTTAAVMATPSGARPRVRTVKIAPGVLHTTIRDPKGPWKIHVISIELDAPSTIEPALATRKLPGAETTSAIANRYGALAAINGDYMRESGRPVMLFAQDGELGQTALTRGVNFAVDESETTAFIQRQIPHMWFRDDAGEHVVNSYNAGWPGADQINAFSALGGSDEKPPYGACNARLYPTEGPRPSSIGIGVGQTHVVHEVACKDFGRMFPKQGRVVSTPVAGTKSTEIYPGLTPGEEVELGWALEWPGVTETLGGNPTLVRDGQIFIGDGDTPFFNRHPRTGVGFTPDNRVLFVTVDGRQAGYSVGMTPLRFAKLFRSLGATYALNLDGGGSTTMVVNGDVVNRPSGGSQRIVSTALLLLPGPDPKPTATPGPVPTPTPSSTTQPSPIPTSLPEIDPDVTQTQAAVWREVVTDPASTGGLAVWLQSRGIRLHGSLREAAWLFHHLR